MAAIDQDGEVVDVYLQEKRDGTAAKRFFKRLLRRHGEKPGKIVTDRHANNRIRHSHEATRVRERGKRKFKSKLQAQRFVDAFAAVQYPFNLGRHLVRAKHYRNPRVRDAHGAGPCRYVGPLY
jgi:putative transposase